MLATHSVVRNTSQFAMVVIVLIRLSTGTMAQTIPGERPESSLSQAGNSTTFKSSRIKSSRVKAAARSSSSPVAKQELQIFLLIGQSNMAGRGKVSEADRTAHPRVWMFNADQQWVPAVDPMHFDKPGIVGVGLGKTFGERLAETWPNQQIGLVPCAVGGSPIDAWKPGGFHAQTKTHPYDDMLERMQVALRHGRLRGILWHQGESDSKPELATAYRTKLHQLVARLREQWQLPELPFVAGQMGQFPERPWSQAKQTVDRTHRLLPLEVPFTAFVDSNELTHKGDEVHFNADSYRRLGERYATAFMRMLPDESAPFRIRRKVVREGFDGQSCWVHARAGFLPANDGAENRQPRMVMTMQKLLLSGSDVFYRLHTLTSADDGVSWSEPVPADGFARQQVRPGVEKTVCDFTPMWHAGSGKLLGTGQTVWYQDNHVMRVRPRSTAYATYQPQRGEWSAWRTLDLPDQEKYQNAGAGSVQRFDLDNGEILLPISMKTPQATQYSTTVCLCRFDGERLHFVRHGNELTVPIKRGLYEPSLTRFQDRFFLTMRNDDRGYVAVSEDGLNFGEPKPWTFDDGAELGNYNTQQHWVTHPQHGLFLVYTRRGANNDHVFRHRAPLFIARVNPQSLQVVRASERVVVPEYGARLGNFAVADDREGRTWVTVTEWMQPEGVQRYGSNNRVIAAQLLWEP